MAKRFRQRALSWIGKLMPIGLLLSAPLGAEPHPGAEPDNGIAGFSSSYTLKASNVPFSINAERSLIQLEDGSWRMRIEASNWLGRVRETTLFSWQECLPQTTYYGYHRRGLGRSRSSDLHFDREQQLAVLYRDKEEVRSYPISAQSTDLLSVPLALQCQLQRDEESFQLEVASERRLQQYDYVRLPVERLRTSMGRLDTIPVEMQQTRDSDRRTTMWFAPSLGYTLVRMIQEDDGERFELTINEFK